MRAVIFYGMAEYCDYANKMTIKTQGNQVRIEIWSSSAKDILVKTEDYKSPREANRNFKIKIGEAILGGWHVLNAYPQRETWETKRSK